jgi:gas vesicle protein
MKDTAKRGGSGLGFLLGILFGVAVGVIVAILLAPQSGEETRKNLVRQSQLVRERYEEALSQGRDAQEHAKEEVLASLRQ